ncbi:MAG: leucine-rich repeat domain-containing protein, partial [Clostridiales bacterium]|nr:leucine-rich repeat domain-containing protein [Clostridiales bacterium]
MKKKRIMMLAALFASMLALVACAGEQEKKGDDGTSAVADPDATEWVVYTLSPDGTYYVVSGYTGTATEVNIAGGYKGKPVSGIAERAFEDCTIITSITVPESVKNIGFS